jgi:hypothetical protein
VTSCFEVSIETNLMMQSEFNLFFWFVSYNIFSSFIMWGPYWYSSLSLISHKRSPVLCHASRGWSRWIWRTKHVWSMFYRFQCSKLHPVNIDMEGSGCVYRYRCGSSKDFTCIAPCMRHLRSWSVIREVCLELNEILITAKKYLSLLVQTDH